MKAAHEGVVGYDGKICDALGCWCRAQPATDTIAKPQGFPTSNERSLLLQQVRTAANYLDAHDCHVMGEACRKAAALLADETSRDPPSLGRPPRHDCPCNATFLISPLENHCLNCGWMVRDHQNAPQPPKTGAAQSESINPATGLRQGDSKIDGGF